MRYARDWQGFDPDIASASDYHGYGMAMTGRIYAAARYEYGQNTQMKSPELAEGHYTAEFWEYDSRIARRWELDPIFTADFSRYAVNGDNPIVYTDPNGDFKTKLGAWVYKLFNGGNRIEKATNGEYFVGTDVEYKGGDDYVSYKRRFDWSGRSKENGGGNSGGGSLLKGLGGMFKNTGANVPNRRLTDYSLRLSNNHYGSYFRQIEEQLRSIRLMGRNVNYELGMGASLIGGFGGGVGVVFDEIGDWKLYWTANVRVGYGGNVGLSVNRIIPGEGKSFLNSEGTFEGTGTEFSGGEGPVSFSRGRNFTHKEGDSTPLWQKIGEFWGQGDNYTTLGAGIEIPLVEDIFGPAAAKSAPKLKPSLNVGAELKYSYTKFFF